MTAPEDIVGLLTTPVELRRETLDDDGAGGSAAVALLTTETAGHLQPRRPRELLGAQQEIEYDHVLYLAPDEDVRRGDRFVLTADRDVQYRVVDIRNPSYADHHLEVLARREIGEAG